MYICTLCHDGWDIWHNLSLCHSALFFISLGSHSCAMRMHGSIRIKEDDVFLLSFHPSPPPPASKSRQPTSQRKYSTERSKSKREVREGAIIAVLADGIIREEAIMTTTKNSVVFFFTAFVPWKQSPPVHWHTLHTQTRSYWYSKVTEKGEGHRVGRVLSVSPVVGIGTPPPL